LTEAGVEKQLPVHEKPREKAWLDLDKKVKALEEKVKRLKELENKKKSSKETENK